MIKAGDAVAAITSWLPTEIDHVLLQGDMTMIAPGPLTATLSRQLRVLADIESRGHATAYRITPESIRLRKRFLKEHERKRASREAEAGRSSHSTDQPAR